MTFRQMTKDFFDNVARSRTGWSRVINIGVSDKDAETSAQKRKIASMLGDEWKHLSVLDMGCGVGRLTGWFDGLAGTAHGVDWSPEMLKIARKENPGVTFHEGGYLFWER